MTSTFGKNGGPSGLSMNAKPKTRQRTVQCQGVLDALVTITGQNFGYDPRAWLSWYRNQVAAAPQSPSSELLKTRHRFCSDMTQRQSRQARRKKNKKLLQSTFLWRLPAILLWFPGLRPSKDLLLRFDTYATILA